MDQFENKREEYSSKTNFISQLVESTNAKFRVPSVDILGKAETAGALAKINVMDGIFNLPLASSSRIVDDCLGGLNLSKSGSVGSESLIVSVWMKSTNVDVAIAGDGVRQALVKSSHALTWSEDSWYSRRNNWVLNKQSIDVNINWDGLERHLASLGDVCWELLWRGCRTKWRTVYLSNVSTMIAQRDRAIVRSTRSRFVGRVGAATVLKTWNILVKGIYSLRVVTTGSWSVWHHGRIAWKVARVGSLRKVRHGGGVGIVRAVGDLSWRQRLGRIHGRRTEKLTISSNVELRIGADRKLVGHGPTAGNHAATSKRNTSK